MKTDHLGEKNFVNTNSSQVHSFSFSLSIDLVANLKEGGEKLAFEVTS